MMTIDDIRKQVADQPDRHVKVGVFDLDGVMRGKYLSAQKFLSALEGGLGFCDVVLGWDVNDQLYDNVAFTGWHTGYPDAPVRLLPESVRTLPLEDNRLFCLGEFADGAEALCPRGLLRRVLARAADMGFAVCAGFEYEFLVFEETAASASDKNYRDLTPLAPGNFGYSVLRNCEHADFYDALLSGCTALDIALEGLHEETGPGVLEAAITVDEGLAAADKAALFKTFSKVIARTQGKILTFMAKCDQDAPGQGGHIHVSLHHKDGGPAFYDETQEAGISKAMRSFIAGQQRFMPEFLALMAPTVNSFTRLVPGYWAPTSATWGIENRTCALRAIPGSAKAQRVELRVPGADANPYLALAAGVAAGLAGIAQGLEPDDPIGGNAYDYAVDGERQLPATLWEAAQRLKASNVTRDWLGDAFVEHFAASREWEEREFRRHVTDWERARYFEII